MMWLIRPYKSYYVKAVNKLTYTPPNENGYTIIELAMTIVLIGILSVTSIAIIGDSLKEDNFEITVKQIKEIRNSLIGNSDLSEGGVRNYFGYLGDIGALPSTAQGITALISKPTGYPFWTINSTYRIGSGWNGPYLTSSDPQVNYLKDAWGNNLVYTNSAGTITITSYAGDGVVGGNGFDQDIIASIPSSLQTATIHGFISNNGRPISNTATVELYVANGAGAATTISNFLSANDAGHFSFSDVPLGVRSATIYIPTKEAPAYIYGPALFTVDRNNFIIPNEIFNLSGCVPSGVITLVSNSLNINATSVTFRIDVSRNISIISLTQTSNNNRSYNQSTIDGKSYDCTPPSYLLPNCPVSDSIEGTFSPIVDIVAGNNKTLTLVYTATMAGTTTYKVSFIHNLGCDTLILR